MAVAAVPAQKPMPEHQSVGKRLGLAKACCKTALADVMASAILAGSLKTPVLGQFWD